MEGKFEVTYRGQSVGTVEVKREGLYCRILCRCRMVNGDIHRLYADGEKIGVLVPDRGELVLETKVAAKRLREGCTFSMGEGSHEFVPIRPGEIFGCLDKVRLAKLAFREGEPGLFLD